MLCTKSYFNSGTSFSSRKKIETRCRINSDLNHYNSLCVIPLSLSSFITRLIVVTISFKKSSF